MVALLVGALGAPAPAMADDLQVGTIVQHGGSTLPTGWLWADGTSRTQAAYPQLYALLDGVHGGDVPGDGIFTLPDLRQRHVLGTSTAGIGSVLGGTGGAIDHIHAIPSHAHSIAADGAHQHTVNSHAHNIPGHGHVFGGSAGFTGVSMTANGGHDHQNGGGAMFQVEGSSNARDFWRANSGTEAVSTRANTSTDGNHRHTFNGQVGDGTGPDADTAFAATANDGLANTSNNHAHGGATNAAASTSSASNAPFLSVNHIVKASEAAVPPCGAIWATGRATASTGALLAGGASLAQASYPALHGCIGTTFGSIDAASFSLPDLRGRFPLGKATTGTGTVLGSSGGSLDHAPTTAHQHTLGTTGDGDHGLSVQAHGHTMPGHEHTASIQTTLDGDHNHGSNAGGQFIGDFDGGLQRGFAGTRDFGLESTTSLDGNHSHSISADAGTGGTNGNVNQGSINDTAGTGTTAGGYLHGGATLAGARTLGASNPPFQTVNFETYGSTSYTTTVGTMAPFAASTVPAGWMVADGRSLSRAAHPALFAAIGTTYGSVDAASFTLPDLRGRFALGKATAGTGSTLGETGGSLDHDHDASHAHGLAFGGNHAHNYSHNHDFPGHHHPFTRTFSGDGAHRHNPVLGWSFWGNAGGNVIMNVTQCSSSCTRDVANVARTDNAWGTHRHSDINGDVGNQATSGNVALTSTNANPATDSLGAHDHGGVGTAALTSGGADPPFASMRWMIKASDAATIIDNQSGDTTWRATNTTTYDVDVTDPVGLAGIDVSVWSAAGMTGTQRQGWTEAVATGATSHTTNWALPAWAALAEGVNHVSVRARNSAGMTTFAADVFTVYKDTQAAAPTAVNDGVGADVDRSGSGSVLAANWTGSTGEAGRSGVARYDYCISTGADCTGVVARTWTANGTATSVNATGLVLATATTYYVAVRMVDVAGNVSSSASSDGILVDTDQPLAPTMVSPPAGSAHTTWPALTATYVDGSSASPGQLEFELCSDDGCTATTQTSTTAPNTTSGTDRSWTPTAANGGYWWRVRGIDSLGNSGPWSAIRVVVVGSLSASIGVDAALPFGLVTPGLTHTEVSSVTVTSDSGNGYQLLASDTSSGVGLSGTPNVSDWTGPVTAPTQWLDSSQGYFGINVLGASGGRLAKWGTAGTWASTDTTNNLFAGLSTTSQLIHQRSGFASGTDTIDINYRFTPSPQQPAGSYSMDVTYTVVATP